MNEELHYGKSIFHPTKDMYNQYETREESITAFLSVLAIILGVLVSLGIFAIVIPIGIVYCLNMIGCSFQYNIINWLGSFSIVSLITFFVKKFATIEDKQ